MASGRAQLAGVWRWVVVMLAIVAPVVSAPAQSVAQALAERRAEHDVARATQAAIDALQGRGGDTVLTVEDRALEAALAHARHALTQATERQAELELDLTRQREAQAGIVPLLYEMVDLLERSVGSDLPFAAVDRQAALTAARAALARHDLSMADRFDAVLRAYRNELAYGYNSDVKQMPLQIDAGVRLVDVLRIGRIALYYVTEDGTHCGVYQRDSGAYVALATQLCPLIQAAMAPERRARALMRLPLSVATP